MWVTPALVTGTSTVETTTLAMVLAPVLLAVTAVAGMAGVTTTDVLLALTAVAGMAGVTTTGVVVAVTAVAGMAGVTTTDVVVVVTAADGSAVAADVTALASRDLGSVGPCIVSLCCLSSDFTSVV